MDNFFEQLSPESTLPEVREVIARLLAKFEDGDGYSGFLVGLLHEPDNLLISDTAKQALGASRERAVKYYSQAYAVLSKEAAEGRGAAMHLLAFYFQTGTPPVTRDMEQYQYWITKALDAGYRGGGQL